MKILPGFRTGLLVIGFSSEYIKEVKGKLWQMTLGLIRKAQNCNSKTK